ncbi:F-box protein [Vitis vinifera]|uniref:F-box protein n=1 Tax=Vitis vinifera TaxID=29760 RepID=A0A438JXH3_VITVI|nr:F-box protein [Vitis vinifera]
MGLWKKFVGKFVTSLMMHINLVYQQGGMNSNLNWYRLKNCRGLRFNFGQGSFLIATIVPNEALHLDFHTERNESPSEIGGHLKTYRWSTSVFTHPPLTSVSPSNMIRTLHLISVTNLTSEAVSSTISKFQSLENLIIKGCPGLHSLHIDASDRFSHLMIFNCLHLKFLRINASNLDKFRFRGLFPKFTCASSLCLKDAMLDFEGGLASDPSGYLELVSAIKKVQILTLRRWTFEEHMPIKMFGYQEINLHTRFSSCLDYLEELWWIDNSMDKYNIIVLLSFLKMCPSLENLFISIDPTGYSGRSTSKRLSEVPQHTRLNHLKFIKLEGAMKEEDKISLAENLLEENKFLYKFVKVEEGYSGEICSRHVHMDL